MDVLLFLLTFPWRHNSQSFLPNPELRQTPRIESASRITYPGSDKKVKGHDPGPQFLTLQHPATPAKLNPTETDFGMGRGIVPPVLELQPAWKRFCIPHINRYRLRSCKPSFLSLSLWSVQGKWVTSLAIAGNHRNVSFFPRFVRGAGTRLEAVCSGVFQTGRRKLDFAVPLTRPSLNGR